MGRCRQSMIFQGGGYRLASLSSILSLVYVLLELGLLSSTGVTRLHRYYEPVRHPRRPGLSLTRVRLRSRFSPLGLPVLQQLPMYRHAVTITPVGPLDQIARNEGLSTTSTFHQRRRPSPYDRRVGSHVKSFEACSVFTARYGLTTRRTAKTARLSQRLRRLRYLHRRSDSFRLERSPLAGWDLHPLGNCALSRYTSRVEVWRGGEGTA